MVIQPILYRLDYHHPQTSSSKTIGLPVGLPIGLPVGLPQKKVGLPVGLPFLPPRRFENPDEFQKYRF